ncbi:MAG TPA: glucose-1-phosphate cytidylyltransferase [Candidatus Hydrogenedentes bacterium]|nr:glucose-1-phosphate cytidylyltransferase [Candidatus Hydrogenedentota bacterium]HNT86896.1 glucose-1-phosphate cytidylyltransferase [Candidatus Hydrogenedentota bacterium]
MKVVLFCGGLGMRLRPLSPESFSMSPGVSEDLPKPMAHIGGQRPLLWHVMKYYAYFGFNDFILCLGYRADVIKNFFLNYSEYLSNDFILAEGGATLQLLHNDIHEWRITFVDTGLIASVGERLKAVESHLEGEEVFLANYCDGLTDLPLTDYIRRFLDSGKVGAFICVRPPYTTHVVRVAEDCTVHGIEPIRSADVWINGGYFVFRRAIFDYLKPGEDLVMEPFQRLIRANQLFGYQYRGFWTCMDTFKEREELDAMCARGNTPWQVWRTTTPDKRAPGLL